MLANRMRVCVARARAMSQGTPAERLVNSLARTALSGTCETVGSGNTRYWAILSWLTMHAGLLLSVLNAEPVHRLGGGWWCGISAVGAAHVIPA